MLTLLCSTGARAPRCPQILLLYFIALFVLTMKRQIKHMIKYNYIPFSLGKTRYKGRDDGDAMPRGKSAE